MGVKDYMPHYDIGMQLALEQAQLAAQLGEVPVGAVVLQDAADEPTAHGPIAHGPIAHGSAAHVSAGAGPAAGLPATGGAVAEGAAPCPGEKVVARAHNRTEYMGMATRHAEIEAIEQASRHLGRWRLYDCVLYTSLEPCVMCLAAAMAARLKTVVYGAPDPQRGGTFLLQAPWRARFNHNLQLVGPVDPRGGELLRQFFATKR